MQSQIFRIVFDDSEILVIEKLRPFLSQRADSGNQEGIDEFIARALGRKIFAVHRLDREVLGLMIFAKSESAAQALSEQFKQRQVRKIYWAKVQGRIFRDSDTLVHFLSKNPKTKKVTVYPRETPGAKRAELQYRVLERHDKVTELLVDLKTGRTHQIRTQLAKIGHSIVGDHVYGRRGEDETSIQLRSIYLSVVHPSSGESMEWSLLEGIDAKNFFVL